MDLLLLAAPLATLVFCVSEWATKTTRARLTTALPGTALCPAPGTGLGAAPPAAPPAAPTAFRSYEPTVRAQQPAPVADHYLPSTDWDELLVTDADGMPTLYLQMHTGELRLTEPTTGKLVGVGNHHLRRLGIWTVDLGSVGVHKTAAREGLLQPGSPVSLVREPDNVNVVNAIAVHAAAGRPVGYVNGRTAAGLCRLLDAGTPLHAISIAFHSSGTQGHPGGVRVLAASPELVRHLLRKRPAGVLDSSQEMAY